MAARKDATETVESQKETNAKLENMENTLIPTVKELVPDLKQLFTDAGTCLPLVQGGLQ